jgi:hypothetical protein
MRSAVQRLRHDQPESRVEEVGRVCAKHAADGDVAGYTGWSTQLENAKLSSTYTKTSARTTPTTTVTMTSLTGQSCGLVTSAGLLAK